MENLKNLGEPLEFWQYFFQITKIPRCSTHEDQIREYIKKEAEKLGFQTEVDQIKNIVVRIPSKIGNKSGSIGVVLQSHMDMVCEKNEDVIHDFLKDPLKLKIVEIESERWLTAEGTTLGADNGVGIAYQLAIMKKIHDGSLNFDSIDLDLLFTVDEERALTGARQISKDLIKGKYLLNLDSEEDDRFTIGCAGGRTFTVKIKKEITKKNDIDTDLTPIKISTAGLVGGHSGGDIHKGRGNALKIIAQILWKLNKKYKINISSLKGGNLSNAIPRECHAIISINKNQFTEIASYIKKLKLNVQKLYNEIEPNFKISFEKLDVFKDDLALTKEFQDKLLNLLYLMPNGPISLHPTSKGLVHTSSNLASIKTHDDFFEFQISQRSLAQYDKDVIHEKFTTLLKISGLEFNKVIDTEYPSWPPDFDSKITSISKSVYKELFDEEVIIQAIHAGLECSYFGHHFPEMEMISFGPDVLGGHSPDERLKIRSVEKIWKLLVTLLKNLD
jgi:dipeptidase D